jgi:RNA polymerase sigma factor (sigma-70 family)
MLQSAQSEGLAGGSHEDPAAAHHQLVVDAKHGDREARDALVACMTPLIGALARPYARSHAVSHTELKQAGVVGLLRALQRYDPEVGTPFWAYASWWVRQAMQRLVAELARPVVLSDRAVHNLSQIRAARTRYLQAHGSEPSAGALAGETGLSLTAVERLAAAERLPRALDQPLPGGDAAQTPGELLADPRAEAAYDAVPGHLDHAALVRLLRILTPRERLIVAARYGLAGEESSRRQLGAALGISAERVRQVEEHALDKLGSAAGGRDGVLCG